MFAVIKTGGKQYKVASGDVLTVEKLAGAAGETVLFDTVLMIGGDGAPMVGAPVISGAQVSAEVVEQARGDKVIVFKKKRRKNYRRKAGHRQELTVIRIMDIAAKGGAKKTMPKPARKSVPKPVSEPVSEPVAKKAAAAKADKADAPAAKKAAAAKEKPAKPVAKKGGLRLLKKPDGEADDLKQLDGLGPKLEEKLNAYGIYHFDQIAEWGEDDVAKVREEVGLGGKVEQNDWVKQAASLAANKK